MDMPLLFRMIAGIVSGTPSPFSGFAVIGWV